MKKLNKNGWGFLPFLFFMFIFFISTLVVIYMVNNIDDGISLSENEKISHSEYETYKTYERIIKKSLDKEFYRSVVNISELAISNAIKSQCQGYALYNNDDEGYDVYLKCNEYKTTGFTSDYLE